MNPSFPNKGSPPIEGAIVHILNITPKEDKRIEGLKRLKLVSHISMEKIMLRPT